MILLLEKTNYENKFFQSDEKYVPGSCNLGDEEIQLRKKKALAGFIISLMTIAVLQLFRIPNEFRFLLFAPLFYTIICLYQAQQKFCVVFGIIGIFNFGIRGKSTRIENDENKMKDRINSLKILLITFLLSFLITFIYYKLPI